ncbi:MAG: septum formation inhibitor Maf [Synergistaceae bacterium]|nr:septum formation inhibitor Maf [Synergistaceae bacterium]
MRIILASGSPRRRALLHDLGLTFEVYKPDADESHSPDENPEGLCARLSRLKAEAGAQKFPDALVIAADTIVVIDGRILGKPVNREDAVQMLTTLQGRTHEVLTGLSVCMNGRVLTHTEHTRVKFRPLTESEICAYVSTGECDDKAGAYAVQGKGSLLVESLQGDYFNVVGLPVCRLGMMLHEFGINILAGTE